MWVLKGDLRKVQSPNICLQSAYKCDELLSLGALIYIFVHAIRTILLTRRLMIDDIKNEIYGRF